MLKEENIYDEQGNLIEVKTTEKVAREPAQGAPTVPQDPNRKQTFLPAQPMPQAAPVEPVAMPPEPVQPIVESVAAPLPPPVQGVKIDTSKALKEKPLQVEKFDVKEVQDVEPTEFGLATAAGKLSEATEMVPLIEETNREIDRVVQEGEEKKAAIEERKRLEDERLAKLGSQISEQGDPEGKELSILERVARAALVFLGGVGLKPGQENQVFKHFMAQSEAAVKRDTDLRIAKLKNKGLIQELSPRDREMIHLQQLKSVNDNVAALVRAQATKGATTQKSISTLNNLATNEMRLNQRMNDNLKQLSEQSFKEVKEQREKGLATGKLYERKVVAGMGDEARGREVPLPGSPEVAILGADNKDAKELRSSVLSWNMTLDYIDEISKLRAQYAGKPAAKLIKDFGMNPLEWKKLGISEEKGIQKFFLLRMVQAAQSIVNTGVLQQYELDMFKESLPYNFWEIGNAFEGQMKTFINFVSTKTKEGFTAATGVEIPLRSLTSPTRRKKFLSEPVKPTGKAKK